MAFGLVIGSIDNFLAAGYGSVAPAGIDDRSADLDVYVCGEL
jgi:hypothetical protein